MELVRTLTGQSQKSYYNSDKPDNMNGMGAPTKTLTTTDPTTGVLNHLTESQERKLAQFKDRLEKDGWWSPEGINGKSTHDDGTLLRYLRARKFDIEGAVGQFSETEKWMKENRIEELYEHYDVELYEKARTLYPQWTGRRDKRGIPIYVYTIKPLNSKAIDNYQKESQRYKDSLPNHKKVATPAKMLPLFALYHNLLNFVLPLCSTLERSNPEIPITNSTNIVDISNVGLSQFWNLKSHMQDASVLATAHYPETLDRIFIIGAPSFFPTVWGWIKRWFDPVTVSKIFILAKHEVTPTLSKFMDLQNVPKRYGGELNWDWGDMPSLDKDAQEALEKDGNKGWVRGPCLYLERQRIVVGSDKGKLRRSDEEIANYKPVFYAADDTEEPVHPERRRSSSVHSRASTQHDRYDLEEKKVNKLTPIPTAQEPAPTPGIDRDNLRTSPLDGAMLNLPNGQAAFPATTAEYVSPQPKPTEPAPAAAVVSHESKETEIPQEPEPTAGPVQSTTQAEEADTVSNLPESTLETQAVAPASHSDSQLPLGGKKDSTPSSKGNDKDKPHKKHHFSILGHHHHKDSKDQKQHDKTAAAAATSSASLPASASSKTSAPTARLVTGPEPEHHKLMNQSIADHMQGESISVIPGSVANGSAGGPSDPDVYIASDMSKGLALEADKLHAAHRKASGDRVERFVTANEGQVRA